MKNAYLFMILRYLPKLSLQNQLYILQIYLFIIFTLKNQINFQKMGCATGKSTPAKGKGEIAKSPLQPQEQFLLKLIYNDLAERTSGHKVSMENFRLFFQKNGLWGERLFQQFDSDSSNTLSQQQFMKGLAKIFKSSQDEKIKLLFKFFARHSQKYKQGIQFKQFLAMLYNYPKQDLKKIMNDEDFFTQQLKKHLKTLDQTHRLESIFANGKSNQPIVCVLGDDGPSQKLPSVFGKQLMKKIQVKDGGTNSFKLNFSNRQIEVKAANIQNLVKKFAKNVFNKLNIDIQRGKISQQDFVNWIKEHKNLYNNYYKGFHNEVWQFDYSLNQPKFKRCVRDKQQLARFKFKNVIKECKIALVHSLLVVLDIKSIEQTIIQIICLDGLAVKQKFQFEQGFGLQLCHRDGIYEPRYFFFKDEITKNDWLEVLKAFKGISIDDIYKTGQKIGTGKFSVVYKCTQKDTNKQYAIKVIQSYKLDIQARELIAHESSIMSMVSSPFLIQYKQTIQTKTHIYIITQLVDGKDLFEYVKEFTFLHQKQAALIAYQTILGTKYLHKMGIVHRDLKPQNIMINLDSNGNINGVIKIIDFGFANYLSRLQQLQGEDLLAGTPNYIAPQILKGQKFNEKLDNFAIGSIIYFMVSGKMPFNGYNITQIFQRTIDGVYQMNDKRWKFISQQCKDLISALLKTDPQQRISLDQALKFQWFINYQQHLVDK